MSSLTPPTPAQPPPPAPANTFLDHPYLNTIAAYIVQLQRHPMFTKQRLLALRHSVLVTIGFLVLLYCLIHIQILFFWLLKLLFRLVFKILSMIFWLPLKTVRLLIPKSIDYDILFPLFWLCSVASFYLAKFSHVHICQFYDQILVRRYKFPNYDQTKREDVRRYLFAGAFIAFLLLQCLFILMPIALAIRHQHANPKASSTPVITTPTTTATQVKTTTAKSPVKEVVETMSGNMYKRFIDAFSDDNETQTGGKRAPLVSDEQLEDTLKSIRKSIKSGVNNLKSPGKPKETTQEQKSSRFQRWVVHYLKAPFQKWEGKKAEMIVAKTEQQQLPEEQEEEEEDVKLNSSSSVSDNEETDQEDDEDEDDLSDFDDEDDDDADGDNQEEEHATIAERIQQSLDGVKDFGEKIKDNVKSKLSSSSNTEDDEDSDVDDDGDEDEEEDEASPVKERLTQSLTNIKEEVTNKLSSSTVSDDEDSDGEDEDDEEEDEPTATDKIKEQLAKPMEKAKSIAKTVANQLESKMPGSTDDDESDDDEEESGYESDEEEEAGSGFTDRIKDTLAEPIEKAKDVACNIKDQVTSSLEKADEASASISKQLKETMAEPIEKVKKAASNVKDKVTSSLEGAEEASEPITEQLKETLADSIEKAKSVASDIKDQVASSLEKVEEASASIAGQVKESFEKPVESVKELGEKVVTNAKSKLPSSAALHKEEDHPSLLNRVKENVLTPIETTATNLRDKLPSLNKKKKEPSLVDRAGKTVKEAVEPIKDQIVSNAEKVKDKADDLLGTAEEFAADVMDKSSKFVKDKTKKVEKSLPKTDQVVSKIKHDVVEPLEAKASKVKNDVKKTTDQLETAVVNQVKSLKKGKKPKTLVEKAKEKFRSLADTVQEHLPGRKKKLKTFTEKAKDKLRSLADTVQEHLPGHKKKKPKKPLEKGAELISEFASNLQLKKRLNGWLDDAWNVWHLATAGLAHIFTHSTKHARHLPRYNTTSLYTAYTDLKCYDYTKKTNRYRGGKGRYHYFLDTYRRHSPFPVYLSILKSNGPKCYRRYPDSTCALIPKTHTRNFKVQLYRFVRFWAMVGVIIAVLSLIYKYFTARKQSPPAPFRRPDDSDRSTHQKQATPVSPRSNPASSTTTTQKTPSGNQSTAPATPSTQPLDEKIEAQLRLCLQREQNDGFRNLSETCRLAINNTFVKQLVSSTY